MWITDYTYENNGYEVGEHREPLIKKIVNEDGTDFNPPKNPLMSKWLRDSPPSKQYSEVCDGYSCMWCSRCPHGDKWQIPEEDKEIYEQYMRDLYNYVAEHNNVSNLIKLFKEVSCNG